MNIYLKKSLKKAQFVRITTISFLVIHKETVLSFLREDVFVFLFSLCWSVGSATVISPLELIRTKLQSQKQSYRELTDCIRSAVQSEGWWSLWRGLGPTLLRDVPFSAMYWYNYEKGKSWLCERYNTREPNFTITFMSGAASGSVSATTQHSAFQPVDEHVE